MAKGFTQLPRLLREPTGWIVIVLAVLFIYLQWPTRVKTDPVIDYQSQTYLGVINVDWEATPEKVQSEPTEVWALTRKKMSFLVQIGPLLKPFAEQVAQLARQDRATVGGAEQDPLVLENDRARYALFDAEGRVQEHRVFQVEDQWVKVSVLYKPSLDSRVRRAQRFISTVDAN